MGMVAAGRTLLPMGGRPRANSRRLFTPSPSGLLLAMVSVAVREPAVVE
jgi:hypothetical protein